MSQVVDFQLNIRPGSNSLTALQQINSELERMIRLQKEAGVGESRKDGATSKTPSEPDRPVSPGSQTPIGKNRFASETPQNGNNPPPLPDAKDYSSQGEDKTPPSGPVIRNILPPLPDPRDYSSQAGDQDPSQNKAPNDNTPPLPDPKDYSRSGQSETPQPGPTTRDIPPPLIDPADYSQNANSGASNSQQTSRPRQRQGGNYGASATDNAAFAAGMSSSASSSTLGDTLFGMSTAAVDPDNPDSKNMTHEQRAAARLRRWQITMGIQSVGYGLEDIYYSGARGALNNLPFAAQGLAAAVGVNPEKAERVSGITALLATGAMVAYDNREGLAKSAGIDLGKREDKIMGVIPNYLGMPDLSDTQAAQKKVTDAMYYVDKYGEKSNEGKKYKEEAIKAMVDVQSAQARDTSPAEIARVRSLPSVEAMSSGEILGRTGLGGDRMTANLAQSKAVSESSASQISKALSGDPKAISALQQDIKDNKLSGRDMTMAQSVVNMGGNMSAFDAKRIESLRASASNPFTDIRAVQGTIQGIARNSGASNEDAIEFSGGKDNADLKEVQRRAPQNWEANFDMNKDRYVANIAASLGGIQANGSRGNARASQTNNLKGQIYSDLVNSGVPANKARELANQLYMEGNGQFRGRMDAASGASNGMSQMQNFMGMLGDEQQMAFGQFQQNRMQIQMHQTMLRRQALMRSRFGMRGNR
jgi:hypothetical protein